MDTKIYMGAAPHARQRLAASLGLHLAGGVGGHPGALAEFAAVDADLLAINPTNLSMRESAAPPPVFIAAWEELIDRRAIRGHLPASGVTQLHPRIHRRSL